MLSEEIAKNDEILKRIYRGGFFFSIISVTSSFFILFLIGFNKILKSLTYNFLFWIFVSEILCSIGNICEFKKNIEDKYLLCRKGSLFLIPFSDIFTLTLFCFFSNCSVELIKKSNRTIKDKEKKYFLISFILAIIYSIIVFPILALLDTKDKNFRFYFYEDSKLNFIRFIHVVILALMTCFIFYKTIIVIQFLDEKKKSDKINSWKIAKLIKILFRFPLICLLYWIFYISTLFLGEGKKISHIFKVISMSFLSLRGFLIFLNTMQTNKVQIILQRFFEITIKHKLILSFDLFSHKKRRNTFKDKEKIIDDEN